VSGCDAPRAVASRHPADESRVWLIRGVPVHPALVPVHIFKVSFVSPSVFLFVVASGVITGMIGALFGIGGGIFLIPVLVLVFHLPMHQALAASIIAVIATSSSTASVYVEKSMSNIRLGMSLEVMTTAGAILGGLAANLLPADTLKKFFACFLITMAGLMWDRTRRHGEGKIVDDPTARVRGVYHDPAEQRDVRYSVRRLPAGMAVSFLAGNISGLLGVGGGIIKVPVMNMVCGVPIKAATATSNFMIGVTAVASAFIYFAHGNVQPYYSAAAVLGVLAGSKFGTRLGAKLKGRTIISLFILLMLVVAVRMFFS
jgi:uncharacterized protein